MPHEDHLAARLQALRFQAGQLADAVRSAAGPADDATSAFRTPTKQPAPGRHTPVTEVMAPKNLLFEEAALSVGTRVEVSGIASKPELNGARGTITSFNTDTGRYGVQMADLGLHRHASPSGSNRPLALRAENLKAHNLRTAAAGQVKRYAAEVSRSLEKETARLHVEVGILNEKKEELVQRARLLDAEREAVLKEREAMRATWDDERARLKATTSDRSVVLNVGGTRFSTTRATLSSNTSWVRLLAAWPARPSCGPRRLVSLRATRDPGPPGPFWQARWAFSRPCSLAATRSRRRPMARSSWTGQALTLSTC